MESGFKGKKYLVTGVGAGTISYYFVGEDMKEAYTNQYREIQSYINICQ